MAREPVSERDFSAAAPIFFASCMALVATAITFGVRADVMDSLASEFQLSRQQTGWIAGTAFWGFTVSMFLGGQLCDLLGMRRLIAGGFLAPVEGMSSLSDKRPKASLTSMPFKYADAG